MKAYKLTLTFEDINQIIDFYKIGLSKPKSKVLEMVASMGSKGQITPNPDNSVSMTWYFRTLPKYNKIVDAYLKCKISPSAYIPATTKMNYESEHTS